MKNLNQIFIEILKNRKITQTKLSEKIGVSTGYISDLKKGNKIGSEKTIKDIGEALSLTILEEKQLWEAWSYERAHKETMDELFKLKDENKKLRKIIKELEDKK